MAIPTYDYLTIPYDEDNLEGLLYQKTESRYVPSLKFVKKVAYIDLSKVWRSPENAQSYLDLLSSVIYTYILSRYDNKYRFTVLWHMSHSKQVRNALMSIFTNSVWYNHRDGGFMLVYSSGVNLDQMKDMKFDLERALSPVERQIIDNSFLGTRIIETNFNTITKYATYALLSAGMVTSAIITADEALLCEDIDHLLAILAVRSRYRIYLNEDQEYCLEDTKTYENVILASKYEFNTATGTW
jgi:hypothetical protein